MSKRTLLLLLAAFLCDFSIADQRCKEEFHSKEDFLLSYESMCYYEISVESEIVNFANIAKNYEFNDQYLKVLELAEKRGSVEAQFLLGKYFFESSQSEKSEEERVYKLAKGITKLSLSSKKGFEKAINYYVKNICDSKELVSPHGDEICSQHK